MLDISGRYSICVLNVKQINTRYRIQMVDKL